MRLTGSGLKTVTAPIRATTITGAPITQAVPVAKSFTVFGQPVITKTLKQPDLMNVIKKTDEGEQIITPVNTAGTWKLGRASAEQVLQKTEVEPFGSGLEVMTGSKMQTAFNRDVVKELINQGKMSKEALEEMDLTHMSLLTTSPASFNVTFFRPYVWEV